MKQESSGLPALLYGADGRVVNSILLQHERDFTLLFLRETIAGERLTSRSLVGQRLLLEEEMPKLLSADDAPLTIRPTDDELAAYGHLPNKIPEPLALNHDDASDHLESQFVKRFRYATVRQGLNDKIDMQRTVLSLAMERVLDCVQAKDVDAFMLAQRDMEVAIQLGIKILDPELIAVGVEKVDRTKFFGELGEGQIKMAIRQRLGAISDEKEQEKFYKCYEQSLHAYQEEVAYRQSAPRLYGPLGGGAAELTKDNEPSPKVSASSIRRYFNCQLSAPTPSNDNARA